jgi:hypothetical protein
MLQIFIKSIKHERKACLQNISKLLKFAWIVVFTGVLGAFLMWRFDDLKIWQCGFCFYYKYCMVYTF